MKTRELNWALVGAAGILAICLWVGARKSGEAPEREAIGRAVTGAMSLDPFSSPAPVSAGEGASREALKSAAPDSQATSELAEAPAITGKVLDEHEQPIAGAQLVALRERASGAYHQNAEFSDEVPRLGECESDARGEFRMPVPPDLLLQVWADAVGSGSTFGGSARAGDVLVIHLLPCGSIEGRCVTTHGGAPIARVRVQAIMERGALALDHWPQVESNEQGRFLFQGLPPGTYSICGCLEGDGGLSAKVVVEPGKPAPCELVLGPSARVHGFVRDALTKAPIVGAEVGSWVDFRQPASTTVDGEFEFQLPIGALCYWTLFSARAPGYSSARISWVPQNSDPTQEVRIDLELAPEHSCTGIVQTMKGVPVEGAAVCVRGSGYPQGSVQPDQDLCRTRTGGDGSFSVSGLRGDLSHEICISKPGFATKVCQLPRSELARSATALGVLRLGSPHTITGSVRTDNGRAVPGCRVRIEMFHTDTEPWSSKDEEAPDHSCLTMSIRADEAGCYCFTDLPEGPLRLTASRPGRDREFKRELQITCSSLAIDVPIVFPCGLSISGTVRDLQGNPVPWTGVQATQYLASGAMESGYSSPNADGTYRIEGLAPGNYTLRTFTTFDWQKADLAEPYLPGTLADVPAGSTGIDLLVRTGVVFRARFIESDGTPASHLSAILTDSSDRRRGWIDDDYMGFFCVPVERGEPHTIEVRRLVPSPVPGESPIADPDDSHVIRFTGLTGGGRELEIRLPPR